MKTKIVTSIIVALLGVITTMILPQSVFTVMASSESNELNILILGDSYSAGNGAGSYSGIRGCYRSQNSWGQRYAEIMQNQGINVAIQNRACSGAKVDDLIKARKFSVNSKTVMLPDNLSKNHTAMYSYLSNSGSCQFYWNDDPLSSEIKIS